MKSCLEVGLSKVSDFVEVCSSNLAQVVRGGA